MTESESACDTNYCWIRAKGKYRLSPLRARVHDLLEECQTNLSLDEIYETLDPPADSPAKKTAVRMAPGDLRDKGLVATAVAEADPPAVDTSRSVAATTVSPKWACPAPGKSLKEEILAFLQKSAMTKVQGDPSLDYSDIWFRFSEIHDGVGRTESKAQYKRALTELLYGKCVDRKDDPLDDYYQALTA